MKVKPGFKYVRTHIIFDIKMDVTFTCKAILVANRHNMSPLFSITYSIVVTRESVTLEFLISGLNNLDIFACDIGTCIPQCSLSRKTVDQSRIRIWGLERVRFPNFKSSSCTEVIRVSLESQSRRDTNFNVLQVY